MLTLGNRYPTLLTGIASILSVNAFSGDAYSDVYFTENFEAGAIHSSPSPKWSWNLPTSLTALQQGMMYSRSGQDIYAVTSEKAFSGTYAMRLNFHGRNHWCNQCGSQEVILDAAALSAGCVSVAGGPWSQYLFNKSNGFSTWNIVSSNNNQVCFDTANALGNSINQTNALRSGDQLAIPYQCGINGTVGGNVSRRSDCNKAINYLIGVSAAQFPPGGTLARRFYMYIPSETTLPGTTLKLGYSHYDRGNGIDSITLKLSVQRGLTVELSAPGGKVTDPYAIAKDKWYYFEEVFVRESVAGKNDGSYTLYIAPADKPVTRPIVSQTNVTMGVIKDMSINGNFQHNNDARGSIYFDDIEIANSRIGPLKTKVPRAPTAVSATVP